MSSSYKDDLIRARILKKKPGTGTGNPPTKPKMKRQFKNKIVIINSSTVLSAPPAEKDSTCCTSIVMPLLAVLLAILVRVLFNGRFKSNLFSVISISIFAV